jgi:hypothetical protein
MFESIPIIELIPIIIGIIGAAIGASVAVRSWLKGPHVTFSLEKAAFSLDAQGHDENIALLMAPVANKKKRFIGDAAKRVSGLVLYRAPVNDEKFGLNAAVGLPWLKPFGTRTRLDKQLKSEEDIQQALEEHLFDRLERDIPQGRGEYLAVAYGVAKTNRLFLASNPPIEIPLPPPEKVPMVLTSCFLRLEVAGENVPSTLSEPTVIVAGDWKNWQCPKAVTTIRTPSKFRNLLLRMGFHRKVKVLESKTRQG